jgi:hypothetical protein
VDRADPRAGQHGDRRLGHHRHVDDDPVALADPPGRERAREGRDLVAQLGIGVGPDRVGDWRVVDQRGLGPAAVLDVAVDRVVAGVQHAAGEPAIERLIGIVEDLVPGLLPMDRPGRLRPEPLRVLERAPVDLVETPHRLPPSAMSRALSPRSCAQACGKFARHAIRPGRGGAARVKTSQSRGTVRALCHTPPPPRHAVRSKYRPFPEPGRDPLEEHGLEEPPSAEGMSGRIRIPIGFQGARSCPASGPDSCRHHTVKPDPGCVKTLPLL